MRKLATWAFAFILLFALAMPAGTTYAKAETMKFLVDGVEVKSYEQPFMSQGQALIPVEDLFSEAGFKVSKDDKGKVSVTNSHLTVGFDASAKVIEVDGKKVNAEFPLTLKNAGNYISGEFLSQLEGFEVEVSEDEKTVSVTTNRVKDVDAFLEKMLAADLNSYSSHMTLDQKMNAPPEEESMDMFMDITMDVIQEPVAMHMLTKLKMDIAGEKVDQTSEAYFTKDGFYQNDGDLDKWVKLDDGLTEGLLEASIAQADPKAQLELVKKFIKGIHIYEYDDVYIMTQTMTNEEFGAMMEDMMSMLTGLLPEGLIEGEVVEELAVPTEDITKETEVTSEIVVETEKSEEAVEAVEEATDEKATDGEEATEAEKVEEEGNIDEALDGLGINIDEYYVITTIDKKTLFPISTSGKTKMTIGIGDESVSIVQIINGTYSNYNAVEEIKIPAAIIKNALTMEEYLKELGFEEELD